MNENAINLHKGQFKNYVLLGDSVASGYRDEMSENDSNFVDTYNNTTYWRVPGSYGDIIANSIIEDKSMTAFAGPGFRTTEIRYMLEDDFAANCTDEYLFHPSQLYVYEKYGYLPSDERVRTAYQEAIKNADLISLGVGGNDWGAYLGWVVADVFEKENIADKYVKEIQEIIDDGKFDISMIEKLVEVAHVAGALPELLATIPTALTKGLSTFYNNWDIMIEDIYALNPDVTLMVTGMSDNSLKGHYFDYDGVKGEAIENEQNVVVSEAMSLIVDFIMSVGNKPMIEGASKYGYIYVDTTGTTYVDSHPDADGHAHIANKIIEALPDPDISTRFDDLTPGHKYYKEIEYTVLKGILSGVSDTSFSPDSALTESQLTAALNSITGSNDKNNSTKEVTYLKFALSFFKTGTKVGISGLFKGISTCFNIISNNLIRLTSSVSRGESAKYFKNFCA